jgi:hypothetical protein
MRANTIPDAAQKKTPPDGGVKGSGMALYASANPKKGSEVRDTRSSVFVIIPQER